ncbi:MAG: GHMP kinase, partial [Candidatus Latescibacteria bacterium]|nr:GHMP kinase [Candidatus Latescibacterota bacterium]
GRTGAIVSSAGLGAPETDRIVDLVRERGVECGLYGVKITGGGSGGTVAVLCRTDTDEIIEEIAAKYQESIGISPQVLTGSSPGACEAGHLVTRL